MVVITKGCVEIRRDGIPHIQPVGVECARTVCVIDLNTCGANRDQGIGVEVSGAGDRF